MRTRGSRRCPPGAARAGGELRTWSQGRVLMTSWTSSPPGKARRKAASAAHGFLRSIPLPTSKETRKTWPRERAKRHRSDPIPAGGDGLRVVEDARGIDEPRARLLDEAGRARMASIPDRMASQLLGTTGSPRTGRRRSGRRARRPPATGKRAARLKGTHLEEGDGGRAGTAGAARGRAGPGCGGGRDSSGTGGPGAAAAERRQGLRRGDCEPEVAAMIADHVVVQAGLEATSHP